MNVFAAVPVKDLMNAKQRLIPALTTLHPRLSEPVVLPGCGHWTQQERPAEVNAALLEFLDSLPR